MAMITKATVSWSTISSELRSFLVFANIAPALQRRQADFVGRAARFAFRAAGHTHSVSITYARAAGEVAWATGLADVATYEFAESVDAGLAARAFTA